MSGEEAEKAIQCAEVNGRREEIRLNQETLIISIVIRFDLDANFVLWELEHM